MKNITKRRNRWLLPDGKGGILSFKSEKEAIAAAMSKVSVKSPILEPKSETEAHDECEDCACDPCECDEEE